MSISYWPNRHEAGMATVSYQALKSDYWKYMRMDDEEFVENAHQALHFADFMVWYKEIPTQQVDGDNGVVHELIHLVLEREGWDMGSVMKRLPEIRRVFKRDLELA